MGVISNNAKQTLYPLGDLSDNTLNSFIYYIRKLMGELKYIEPNKDWARIVNEWFDEDCIIDHDKDILRERIHVAQDAIYPIKSDHKTVVEHLVVQKYYTPKCLLVNDYLPIRALWERMYEVMQ